MPLTPSNAELYNQANSQFISPSDMPGDKFTRLVHQTSRSINPYENPLQTFAASFLLFRPSASAMMPYYGFSMMHGMPIVGRGAPLGYRTLVAGAGGNAPVGWRMNLLEEGPKPATGLGAIGKRLKSNAFAIKDSIFSRGTIFGAMMGAAIGATGDEASGQRIVTGAALGALAGGVLTNRKFGLGGIAGVMESLGHTNAASKLRSMAEGKSGYLFTGPMNAGLARTNVGGFLSKATRSDIAMKAPFTGSHLDFVNEMMQTQVGTFKDIYGGMVTKPSDWINNYIGKSSFGQAYSKAFTRATGGLAGFRTSFQSAVANAITGDKGSLGRFQRQFMKETGLSLDDFLGLDTRELSSATTTAEAQTAARKEMSDFQMKRRIRRAETGKTIREMKSNKKKYKSVTTTQIKEQEKLFKQEFKDLSKEAANIRFRLKTIKAKMTGNVKSLVGDQVDKISANMLEGVYRTIEGNITYKGLMGDVLASYMKRGVNPIKLAFNTVFRGGLVSDAEAIEMAAITKGMKEQFLTRQKAAMSGFKPRTGKEKAMMKTLMQTTETLAEKGAAQAGLNALGLMTARGLGAIQTYSWWMLAAKTTIGVVQGTSRKIGETATGIAKGLDRLTKVQFGTGTAFGSMDATTERTRAIQAISNSGLNARSYLGREATIMAS